MNKKDARLRRARQTRAKIAELKVNRLTVFRTNSHIYAQVYSPCGTQVLASASTVEAEVRKELTGSAATAAAASLIGKHGASRVMLAPAPTGTGVIAGGPMRAVFEVMGVTDIVSKSHGSTNPYNMVRATLDALKRSTTAAEVAAKRGKSVEDILG